MKSFKVWICITNITESAKQLINKTNQSNGFTY